MWDENSQIIHVGYRAGLGWRKKREWGNEKEGVREKKRNTGKTGK